MKIQQILTWLLPILLINSIQAQSSGKLLLQEDKLVGNCTNRYFTGFEIELDSVYTELDSSSLFLQLPRIGTINFKGRTEVPTEFTLTDRAGFAQIMFRFKSSYFTFDSLHIDDHFISFSLDTDPEVPITEDDLEIIRLATSLLSKESYWNKNDDRNCTDDLANRSFSLYCALRIASLEVEQYYNHRNAVLQKLRHLIEEKYPSKTWNHRLADFNNMEETSYEDIIAILAEMEQDFLDELGGN